MRARTESEAEEFETRERGREERRLAGGRRKERDGKGDGSVPGGCKCWYLYSWGRWWL